MAVDMTIHSDSFHAFCKSYETRVYPISHPIKAMMFDNLDIIRELVEEGKARPIVLENIERTLLCRTIYLGCDVFECPECGNEMILPRNCHSRFCNCCGVKYSKQLAIKITHMCLDVPHRHIVFTIPDTLRNWFRQDRSRIDLIFIAARNTIDKVVNQSLYNKLKRQFKKPNNQYYLFKNYRHANHFGMIATLHTFGRDLKWNPHIHCLAPEMTYNPDKDTLKRFTHFNFTTLRKTFQFELLRLIEEVIGSSFKKHKTKYYKDHKDGFYVYAKQMEADEATANHFQTENINACINYCIRYASRPAMAESRILEYDKVNGRVKWFYHAHEDEKRHDMDDDVIEFIKKLILHIPDKYYHCVCYYGFYSNAASKELEHLHILHGEKRQKDYQKEVRKAKRNAALEKLHYRTHLIDSFNRDPLKCNCGCFFQHVNTYNPLEGRSNCDEYRKEYIDDMRRLQIPRDGPTMGVRRTERVRS